VNVSTHVINITLSRIVMRFLTLWHVGSASQSVAVPPLRRGVRGRRVEIVPVSDSESTEWHPSMVRSPPGFPAKSAFAAEAARFVGGDTVKAGGSTVQDVTARIGAARTWAGVAAGPLPASHAAGFQAEASATGAHPEHGAKESAVGEEDADFDDLLAGLTGGAALEGA